MSGKEQFRRPQAEVWSALIDPEILKACIPGCDAIELTAQHAYRITMLAAVGPIRAKFQGKLEMTNVVPPRSYTIAFEGSGGAAGFSSGSADVVLATHVEGTELTYKVQAKVGGKIAQVGSRLIDGVAQMLAKQFFARFKAAVEPANTHAPQSSES